MTRERKMPMPEEQRPKSENRRGYVNGSILFIVIPMILGMLAYNALGGDDSAPASTIIAVVFGVGCAVIILVIGSVFLGGKD